MAVDYTFKDHVSGLCVLASRSWFCKALRMGSHGSHVGLDPYKRFSLCRAPTTQWTTKDYRITLFLIINRSYSCFLWRSSHGGDAESEQMPARVPLPPDASLNSLLLDGTP